jgi:cyclophilin family peptidyl-prolyl cis-trans isomerase
VSSDRRARQKELRRAKREEAERAARRQALTQRLLLIGVIVAILAGAALIFTLARNDSDVAADEFEPPPLSTTTSTEPPLELLPPPPGAAVEGPTPCPEADGSSERTTSFTEPPPMCIDPDADYSAVISTERGDITVELDSAAAPETVNNFVVLARYHYYDDVPFHRIIPGFVIQGGDAVGPELGIGGPGYAIPDELPEEDDELSEYPFGSIAMANSGPDTSGSQFFIVSGESGEQLPALYSRFGMVTDGLDVVRALDALGSDGGGTPLEEILIETITIIES